MKSRLLIADHQASFCESLRAGLAKYPQIDVVATVGDGAEVLERAKQSMPDIVLLDIEMPDMNAVAATRQLLAWRPQTRIIALSAQAEGKTILDMLDAGAAGCVSKEGGWQEVLRAILGVERYQTTYLCPAVLPGVLGVLRARQAPSAGGAALQPVLQIAADTPVAVFAIDREHLVIHWNRACERLTGLPAAEVLGTREHWRAFYREAQPLMADLILDGVLGNMAGRFDYPGLRKSGVLEGGYESEAFIPELGDTGCWIGFVAIPFHDGAGQVAGVIQTLQDVTDRRLAETALKASEERYRALSITDTLTGLFSSRHFHDQVKAETGRAMRYGHPLSLITMEVDNFRRFNDTYGHFEGDRMLEKLAAVIRNRLRLGDSAYRMGGKEFAVLLPDTGLDSAQTAAERLHAAFAAHPFTPWSHLPVYCPVSIGVARHEANEEFTKLIRRANAALAQARQRGGNRVVLAAPSAARDADPVHK